MTKVAKVYIITNKINDKIYVGVTCQNNPQVRWNQHKLASKYNRNNLFYIDLIQYGEHSFEFKVVAEYPTKELGFIEENKLILSYKDNGVVLYNVSEGGGLGCSGYKKTEKDKENISRSMKAVSSDQSWKDNISIKTRGVGCPNVKLTYDQAQEIKELYKTGKYSHRDLAVMYKVVKTTIGNILRGSCWNY